ncbi:hypothetical protein UFOVP817_27 [uncultured Caudovirales phage]|uniref:Uncharacterized protein n=1 Tax=uncultured Caudovirales phage TaxID=2100421 RepID=A0A6J5P6H0_9CAUD|nr:hypothetical protein UFOVP817_27 [uncultured Caudovirales phage]
MELALGLSFTALALLVLALIALFPACQWWR